MARRRLGQMLLERGLITQEQLDHAIDVQQSEGAPLGQILVRAGTIGEAQLLEMLAAQQEVAPWFLDRDPPEADAIAALDLETCQQHSLVPVAVRGETLVVAMKNPADFYALEGVQAKSGMAVEPVLAEEGRLIRAIEEAYAEQDVRTPRESMDQLVEQALKDFSSASSFDDRERADLTDDDETVPVINLCNQIIADAIRMQASDIHIEPRYDHLEVRYRVDGEMLKVREIPKALTPMVTTRIKIMAELDIVEHRVPQDGRITVDMPDRTVDLRVNTMPNYHGQRIVMRILDKATSLKPLEDLGFSEHNEALFRQMITKPYGMVLVTGPTGSGKSTTLYSALGEIKSTTNNILTCEDPVEYEIAGISQSQIHEKVGLSFAALLRASLRQDPDVILVGEIRDRETAETALRAALTGHLVVSTLHCNDASSAIPRLLDMGVDPFLLSTCLIGVTAQRLVRRLCPHCRKEVDDPEARQFVSETLGRDYDGPIYGPGGCSRCYNTGYRGRMGVHEIMPITPSVASVLAERAPLEKVRQVAGEFGFIPLQIDAVNRVVEGKTSLAEARRVVFFETWKKIADVDKSGVVTLRAIGDD